MEVLLLLSYPPYFLWKSEAVIFGLVQKSKYFIFKPTDIILAAWIYFKWSLLCNSMKKLTMSLNLKENLEKVHSKVESEK